MIALSTILRTVFGYLFLILIVRIVGRRPDKQLTPFEFVLVFYMGGLTLTGMVGQEISLTNAFCQILTLAMCHYLISLAKQRSPRVARVLDGTVLMLLEGRHWRSDTLSRMGIQDDDVMATARDQGLKTLDKIDTATLERNGEISIVAAGK